MCLVILLKVLGAADMLAGNVQVLLQAGDLIMSCPVLRLGFVLLMKIRTKSLALFVQPRTTAE